MQGPAGFGKTSLLRQHCQRRIACGDSVAWVRMDSSSGDAAYFLRLLCDAVERLPGEPRRAEPRIEGPGTLRDVLHAITRIGRRLVLVVDNFESAASAHFDAMFAQLLRSLPESVQLCVGTRVLPTARLARLQIREGTVVISNEELCFRPAESFEFFREFGSLNAADITAIHELTDGWPAALQAYRLCLKRGGRFRSEAAVGKGITRELMDFLAAEIFDHLAPELGSLLLELAVPEKLSPALVEHITGMPQGAERLAEIERAGLFLAQMDLGGTWFRFHNLFRQFLLARAAQQFPAGDLQRRHRVIAQWYAAQDFREEVIHHWLEAGDEQRAAARLAQFVDELLAQERLGLIERYADRLAIDAMLPHDNLVHAAIIAYGFRRAFDKADQLLACHAAQLQRDDSDRARVGAHKVSRLFVLAAQDRIDELGAAAADAADHLLDRNGWRYGITLNARAIFEVGRGDFDEARRLMQCARPLHDRDQHAFGQAYQDAITSMALTSQGRVDDAVRGLAAALRRTEERASGMVSAGAVVAAYLASGLYEQGHLEDATRLVNEYGQLVEQQAIVDAVATMTLTQARIAHLAGRRGDAEEGIERVLFVGYRHSLPRLVVYAHAELARQATLDGNLDQAERWLRELPAECREQPRDGLLMFHAGETEACTIGYARWLIAAGRHAEARLLLAGEIRRAATARRRHREMKLQLLMALACQAAGRSNLAGRTLLEALEIGAAGGFVRSFLDEGAPALALIKQLHAHRAALPKGLKPDAVLCHVGHLLDVAGGASAGGVAAAVDAAGLIASLTERERRLMRFVAEGLSNKDLADRLSVSTNTVKWHLRNIFQKLQIANRVQAIALMRSQGLSD
ncbi:LuxR C-terminal-related transcriptional regulator [Hydrocarboniphaga sp.]|uniref:LuxR C-terminal-related transcriptional regulator n=1 Tax=Hydrocarboniphaga sp. TaxID=2033016 RepID=UPI003D0B5093